MLGPSWSAACDPHHRTMIDGLLPAQLVSLAFERFSTLIGKVRV